MAEFKILNNIIDYMESTGSTYKLVTLSIDQNLVDEINATNKSNYSLEEIKKAADKCIAHEWLAHTSIGNKYDRLRITPKGVGAARSKRKKEELKSLRSPLKKVSDYIEDHKGLFVVIGILVAIATLGFNLMNHSPQQATGYQAKASPKITLQGAGN